jgi:hypothetical protein
MNHDQFEFEQEVQQDHRAGMFEILSAVFTFIWFYPALRSSHLLETGLLVLIVISAIGLAYTLIGFLSRVFKEQTAKSTQ